MISAQDPAVAADHVQIYIYSHVDWGDGPEDSPYLEALADAKDSRRYVGSWRGLMT
ncbi:hypothetical protein AB0K34_37225 [Actinomadura sp. NPDC049382]|uniref:hypothetical protein n=1 Tax=Actinomadura sp. NPDC049382 TaxID=3158220 RepID=UPI00342D61C9